MQDIRKFFKPGNSKPKSEEGAADEPATRKEVRVSCVLADLVWRPSVAPELQCPRSDRPIGGKDSYSKQGSCGSPQEHAGQEAECADSCQKGRPCCQGNPCQDQAASRRRCDTKVDQGQGGVHREEEEEGGALFLMRQHALWHPLLCLRTLAFPLQVIESDDDEDDEDIVIGESPC